MRIRKTSVIRIVVTAAASFIAYAGLLCFPQPFFPYSVSANNLRLLSDRPFLESSGERVLELADRKLARSPLYSTSYGHSIFICNSGWRQMLFFNKDFGAGGVAQYPVTPHVFLRNADIERNRLIAPSGKPVAAERTLDYFIAHEVAHQLTGQAIGPLRFYLLPQWVREGYADYAGKGDSFDYQEARRAFIAGAPEMDWRRSGLYWRYHLLVACLLDRRHWSVEQLLQNPPRQEVVEAMVRSE